MMDIKGKTALVTGGASGIGLACVKELLRNEAKVSVCDCDAAKGEEVLQELQSEFGPGRVIFLKTDVTNAHEFENAFKVTMKTFKSLDIVLNNAGVSDRADWERTISINLNAVERGIQLAFQYMGKNNGGRGGILCNTASVAGLCPLAAYPVYSATKHGVIGLTRSYGIPHYFDKTGVKVIVMCPGLTETPLIANTIQRMDEDLADLVKSDIKGTISQKPENVATGMMLLLQTADPGSIWVSENKEPVYEVEIPHYHTLRKK